MGFGWGREGGDGVVDLFGGGGGSQWAMGVGGWFWREWVPCRVWGEWVMGLLHTCLGEGCLGEAGLWTLL